MNFKGRALSSARRRSMPTTGLGIGGSSPGALGTASSYQRRRVPGFKARNSLGKSLRNPLYPMKDKEKIKELDYPLGRVASFHIEFARRSRQTSFFGPFTYTKPSATAG
jgi:hypothetical protein